MDDNRKVTEPYILFQLADTDYGIPCRLVKQMEMVEEMTPVPNAPAYVEGLVFIRGEVVPAINLRARFGFDKMPYDLTTRLMVVRSGTRNVGLIVDSAREFVTLPEEALQPTPESISGLSGDYLKGIATIDKRLILILDVDEVLTRQEKEELNKAVEKDKEV
jgi:purine-binding chemotaxis protein CheW